MYKFYINLHKNKEKKQKLTNKVYNINLHFAFKYFGRCDQIIAHVKVYSQAHTRDLNSFRTCLQYPIIRKH